MKSFIIILFALSFISNCQNNSSKQTIEDFLNYLYETKLFEIFYQIKNALGDDAAYFACEEFLHNNYCEEVVRIYMPTNQKLRQLASIIFEKLNEILFQKENHEILLANNYDDKTLKEIILRIEKRFQKN